MCVILEIEVAALLILVFAVNQNKRNSTNLESSSTNLPGQIGGVLLCTGGTRRYRRNPRHPAASAGTGDTGTTRRNPAVPQEPGGTRRHPQESGGTGTTRRYPAVPQEPGGTRRHPQEPAEPGGTAGTRRHSAASAGTRRHPEPFAGTRRHPEPFAGIRRHPTAPRGTGFCAGENKCQIRRPVFVR